MLNKLFWQRQQSRWVHYLHYWRLVFNDHFIIALFFMAGAMAYSYDQLLSQVNSQPWWRLILIGWVTLAMQVGRWALFVEQPDPVVLLPLTSQIKQYLKPASYYSASLGLIMTLALTVIALPLALTIMKISTLTMIVMGLTVVTLKLNWLVWEKQRFLNFTKNTRLINFVQWGMTLVIAAIMWMGWPLMAWIFSLMLLLTGQYLNSRTSFDWSAAIAYEQARTESIYRFFNLFTDVPQVQGRVKRRAWADGIIKYLSHQDGQWGYLYARGFVRGSDTSGLVVRLTLILAIITFFIPINWLQTVVLALSLYVIVSQLGPEYHQFDNKVFTYLYPLEVKQRQNAYLSLTRRVLWPVAIILILATVMSSYLILNVFIIIIEGELLVHWYLPMRVFKEK
ncbi:ABC transporter permease [uncultured Limosilactobacillus sp.]|uniref:ABC transporter permease n=1 Tax=uncultured Limosilactobacillus sp. TaxID=2837629 RepID=UPI0025CCAD4C|nr:ABC transporter permease [uncultured Limosilactobacillus sp.]